MAFSCELKGNNARDEASGRAPSRRPEHLGGVNRADEALEWHAS